jgi:hypothetical protein
MGVVPCEAVVRAGQSEVRVQIAVSKSRDSGRLVMSKNVLRALSLSEGQSTLMWWDNASRQLRIGPVIGVLGCRPSGQRGLFGESTKIIRDCVTVARRGGSIAYAFKARDINWEEHKVRGWYWSAGGLVRRNFPLPDVVYDRLSSRTAENSDRVVRTKEKLLALPRLSYYNRTFLNKWDVHCMLAKDPEISKYLPATEILSDVKVLEKFLRRYSVVFVKPVDGSLGAGILRIARSRGGYALRYTRLNRPDLHSSAGDMSKVLAYCARYARNSRYVVQRGIRLARIGGGPLDVRVLLQRNVRNRWIVHSTIARLAQPGNVVSNLSDGGQALYPRRAIATVFGRRVRPSLVIYKMKRIARAVAARIEAEMGFEFAEMGIDLGIDRSGAIWIIEANSRPGRQFNEDKGATKISPSVYRLARFLRSRGLK